MKDKNKNNENKLVKSKEKFSTKFLNNVKKRWLISRTNTILLIAILVLFVIFINIVVKKIDLAPIDCTTNKEYTLTQESKSRVQNVDVPVKMYFIGYSEDDTTVNLAKQYNKVNENITIEVIDSNTRTDIVDKYHITNTEGGIVIENGEKSKIIYEEDMYTYDENYNTVDLTEENLTSGILKVTSQNIPNIYFLTGYSNYSLDKEGAMSYLATYLNNEILNYKQLNILTESKIPEDCNTLVIPTPSKDFDELTVNEITKYINNGGNILWLNASYSQSTDLKNVNKILALYGVDPFEIGYIYENDTSRKALGYASCILEDVDYSNITKNLKDVLLLNATKINVNSSKLEELNVEEEDIIKSSDTAYYRKNISNESDSTDGDEQGTFVIGAKLTKTISNGSNEGDNSLKSTLIIYGDNNFISDIQINSQVYPMVFLEDNKDVVLNSIAYLTEKEEDITIRKDYTKQSSFTATDGQKSIIMNIIFIVPLEIIVIGIIISILRRRRN